MEEYDDPHAGPITPEDLLGRRPLPPDARRLGFDRNTEEGAMIALAASLNPAKTSHRVIAWVLLVCFAVPTLLSVVLEIF